MSNTTTYCLPPVRRIRRACLIEKNGTGITRHAIERAGTGIVREVRA
jgi:hypothetical protein